MQIDRSNYEIWLIDWLDGNLNEIQVGQLQHFLKENPDLKEEFDQLGIFRLNPSKNSFPHKNHLIKTASNLSESQFDYLCAAYLENDLSADQREEVEEAIDQDPEKRKTFELIQKMRLAPVDILYKGKNRLFRRTIGQNVIRISLFGLSAAAIIALALITYVSIPRKLPDKYEKTAQIITGDSILKPVEKVSAEKISENKIKPSIKRSKSLVALSRKPASVLTEPKKDSLIRYADQALILINKIPVSQEIDIKGEAIPNTLIALNSKVIIPEYDDGRSKLSKFIAKTFRGKILKEKKGKDSPLKAYEIAEAGVSGLNKLFGWEMALDKRNDENGKLKSIYFSSKILKFNAPIKKSESLQ